MVVVPSGDEIGELLELVRATQGQILERRSVAATLTTLARWLIEQARLLAESEDGGRVPRLTWVTRHGL